MDFGLSEDQELFRDALRGYLAEKVPVERVRAVIDAGAGTPADLAGELAAQGAYGVLVDPAAGGSGLGLLDAVVAATELGRALTPVSYHSAAVAVPLVLEAGAGDRAAELLAAVAAGEVRVAWVDGGVAAEGGRLLGAASFVADACEAERFVVLCDDGHGFVVDADAEGLSVERRTPVDATRSVGSVRFDAVEVGDAAKLEGADLATEVERARDAARLVLAADALGAAEAALDSAVAYAMERKQFGRVIGSFQAVKHLCAEAAAELEPLRSLVWYAAYAWDQRQDDAAVVVALAKAHAADVAERVTSTSVQVFGGMGFTDECDQHLWFKRAGYDAQVLGSARSLRARAARDLLDA